MVGCGLAAINSEGVYLSGDDGGGEGGLVIARPIPAALLGRMAIESASRANAAETIVQVMESGCALKLLFHVGVPVVGAPASERPCVIEYDPRPNGDGVNIRRVDPKIPDAIWVTNHPLVVPRAD